MWKRPSSCAPGSARVTGSVTACSREWRPTSRPAHLGPGPKRNGQRDGRNVCAVDEPRAASETTSVLDARERRTIDRDNAPAQPVAAEAAHGPLPIERRDQDVVITTAVNHPDNRLGQNGLSPHSPIMDTLRTLRAFGAFDARSTMKDFRNTTRYVQATPPRFFGMFNRGGQARALLVAAPGPTFVRRRTVMSNGLLRRI